LLPREEHFGTGKSACGTKIKMTSVLLYHLQKHETALLPKPCGDCALSAEDVNLESLHDERKRLPEES
jgi:hypothetical protein